jgi:hypothetical protein
MQKKIENNEFSISSSPWGYMPMCSILVLLFLPALAACIYKPNSGLEPLVLIVGMANILFYLWATGFNINVVNGNIFYRNGFRQTSKINGNEILKIKLTIGASGNSIYVNIITNKKEYLIPSKIFDQIKLDFFINNLCRTFNVELQK